MIVPISDATLENVMVSESGACKLIDLGMSVHVKTLNSKVGHWTAWRGSGWEGASTASRSSFLLVVVWWW